MKPSIKWGLIAGAVCAVLNVCVSTLFGVCGPMVALLAGAVAGFFTGQAAGLANKGQAAREGALAGGVAGALVFLGQMLGLVGALALVQSSGGTPIFGEIPTAASPLADQIGYLVGGVGAGLCFGLVGLVFSALAGAGTAYLTGPSTSAAAPAPSL